MFSVKPTAFQVSQAGTSLQGVCTTFVKVGQNGTNICLKLKVKVGQIWSKFEIKDGQSF
jgi:hypothetical protein